jgi:hypothetical protein
VTRHRSFLALGALGLAACATDPTAATAPDGGPLLARGPAAENGSRKDAAGAVYSMSNDPRRNTVVVFNRDADGKLRPAGHVRDRRHRQRRLRGRGERGRAG